MAEAMMAERILIAEDDGIIAARLQSILTKMGYAVPAVVASGEEAVRQAAAVRPELVLMDIRLGGDLDGIEAGEQIGDQLGIPLIYLTAYMDEALLQRAKRTEPYGYLVKPIQDRELRATIEVALYKHRTDRQLRESEERYRAVVSQSVEGITLFEAETGCLLEANVAFQHMLGYTAHETQALAIYAVMAHDRAAVDRDMALILKSRQVAVGERQFRCKDGSLIDVEVSASLITHQERPVICLVAHDITGRKQMERQRESLIAELQEALGRVKTLSGLLPICASCKKIRDDHGYWHQVEVYVGDHSNAEFTHGLCPDCGSKLYPGLWEDDEQSRPSPPPGGEN
jgi:PAS domain S-box-containing protein